MHVRWSREPDDRAGRPVVIVLHGRGADETSLSWLSRELPPDVAVAAPRAPLREGQGYAWFAMHGIGRPVQDSLRATRDSLLLWFDGAMAQAADVAVIGFSDGALIAADLALHRRVSAAVLLAGPLPVDPAELPAGALVGTDVLWSYGDQDDVVPRELLERSQQWLLERSGARVTVKVQPGLVHAVSTEQVTAACEALAAGLAQSGGSRRRTARPPRHLE